MLGTCGWYKEAIILFKVVFQMRYHGGDAIWPVSPASLNCIKTPQVKRAVENFQPPCVCIDYKTTPPWIVSTCLPIFNIIP